MSASPEDINALLAGAGLTNGPQAQPMPNPGLPAPPNTLGMPGQAGTPTGFDPQQQQAMLGLYGQRNAQANIERQRKLADQLRSDASGLMKGKQAGRVYVGPKWYDAVANVAANAEGMREDLNANEQATGLDTDYKKTMGDFVKQWGEKAKAYGR